MKSSELQQKIFEILQEVRTSEGASIASRFDRAETFELLQGIINRLPLYPDMIVDKVRESIFDIFNFEQLEDIANKNIKELLSFYLSKNINEEKHSLLIFYLLLDYKLKGYKDFTETFGNLEDYFYSYIIENTEDLKREVRDTHVIGTSKEYNGYILRIDANQNLIPTYETSTKFVNYLYNLNR